MSKLQNQRHFAHAKVDIAEPLRAVTDALERLRYGVIQLTVHDGKLMQIDVTERQRFG